MYATDFEYDGQRLSDSGYIICHLDSGGLNRVSSGSQITFNTTPFQYGKVHGLTSTTYDECLSATFDICKDPCSYHDLEIMDYEYRELVRWLNRREFLPLVFFDDSKKPRACHYEASFNINEIKLDECLYGLELNMVTNRPYGLGETEHEVWTISDTSQVIRYNDTSDEIGYHYPDIVITCKEAGDLRLKNLTDSSTMVIQNCANGEVLTIHGLSQIIETSSLTHKIYNDFNFEFFHLVNTYGNRLNQITSSLKCTIDFKYTPMINGIV